MKPSTLRKRQALKAAAERRTVAMVKRVFASCMRPRKPVSSEVAKLKFEHALRMIAMNGTDAVLLLQERDRTGKADGV